MNNQPKFWDGNMPPLVSVVIPVYNGSNYLVEAIDSALAQTYTNIEIIVVDDGSTDNTWEIIQSYGSKIKGIRKPNGRVSSALNRGIMEASGKYFGWLSHDDLWLPAKLEKQVDFLKDHPEFKACYTDMYCINEEGKIIRTVKFPWYPRIEAMRNLFQAMYISGCSILIEMDIFETIGVFNEVLKTTQDFEMWMRILNFYEIGHIPEYLIKNRIHPSQVAVRENSLHEKEKRFIYQKLFEEYKSVLFESQNKDGITAQIIYTPDTWFADIMSKYRGYYSIANKYYMKSIFENLSFKNPANLRIVLNLLRTFKARARKMITRFAASVKKF